MEEMPRAKRLKMLREAKERKERLERGEKVGDSGAEEEKAIMDDGNEKKPEEDNEDQVEYKDEEDSNSINLAPNRANWDIERDIEPMLKKLEKRTQRAIVEILRK
jgi:coiled-coil domain-containing protein 12